MAAMPYPEPFIAPMRAELTTVGVRELRTAEDVDAALRQQGSVMIVVNSVCGCAAGKARPGIAMALQHTKRPDFVGTVFAVTAFFGGIRMVGPGTASLLATIEAPAGLALAALALGEQLAPAQLVGAALVVSAIVLLQVRVRLPRRRPAEVHRLPHPAAAEAEALAA